MMNKKVILKRIGALVLSTGLILSSFSIGAVSVLADNVSTENGGSTEKDTEGTGFTDTTNPDGETGSATGGNTGTADNEGTASTIGSTNSSDTKSEKNNAEGSSSVSANASVNEKADEATSASITEKNTNDDEAKKKMADEIYRLILERQEKERLVNEVLEKLKKEGTNKPNRSNKPVLADGNYVIECECLRELENQLSMANDMFAKNVDMSVKGTDTTLKFYVANPVPKFPNLGAEGSILRFFIEYNGNKYMAESDITTKPLKPMREQHGDFGLEKDKENTTQILTVKLPTAALFGSEVILKAGGYVNVVMNKDVDFRIKLKGIPADDSQLYPLFSIDGKEISAPGWFLNMLKSGQLGLPGMSSGNLNNNKIKVADSKGNTNNSTNLSDGVYSVNGNVLKANGSGISMANDAVDHTMYITVKNGKANLILTFKGLALNGMYGYLGYLNYFETMNSTTAYKSEVLSRQISNGSIVSDSYGTNYPKDIMFPLPSEAMSTGRISVQVFVPIMESLSAGNGTQKAIIELAINNLSKLQGDADSFINSRKEGTVSTNNNTQNNNGKELKLNDGIYKINVNMIKTDKSSASMADNSINHIAKLKVEGGRYYLTLRFNPMNVGGKLGYLGKLKYYTPSYTLNNGEITGSLTDARVEEYHTSGGKKVSDSYGTDYPKACTVEVIEAARKDGFVALNVFVPIMDKISPGAGSQNVFARLDISSVKQTTDTDSDFTQGDSVPTAGTTDAKLPLTENTDNKIDTASSLGDISDSSTTSRVVTQYVSVPSGSAATSISSDTATAANAYGAPNPYYNPYMYYNSYYNPYYNPYAYYQNPYATNLDQKQQVADKKGVANMGTTVSALFGGLSGLGVALSYIFKKIL